MIKILIVDDSPTEVILIQHILESDKSIEVVGIAKNGKEAIELTEKLKPNLITMDIKMPVMDGLEATRIIMSRNPTPIIVISSMINDESINATFHILEAGALTALAKPVNIFSPSFEESKKHIVDTIRSLSDIHAIKKPLNLNFGPDRNRRMNQPTELSQAKTRGVSRLDLSSDCERIQNSGTIKETSDLKTIKKYEIIAMGASVGGPITLKTILSHLTADFPVPIVIVQHMSSGFIKGFSQWLLENVRLKVINPANSEVLQKGTVYIAPEGKHMEIRRTHGKLICVLVDGEPISGFRPSITRLLQSIATTSGKKAIGILLTGMSDDGAQGLLDLKNAHGHTLIQDQASTVVFGMGAVALSLNAVDEVIELNQIASYLTRICTIKSE